MTTLEHFEMADGYACYRPVGQMALQNAVDLIGQAIAFSREQNVRKLLVDTTQLTGFETPNTTDRYAMGKQFALEAQSSVKVVLVARPNLIDPNRFGLTVARNWGLFGNVFASEAEALDWLLDPDAR